MTLYALADKVYTELLVNPTTSVDEMSGRLVIGPDDVRAALDLLSELALVQQHDHGSGELHPVDPRIGFDVLHSRQQAELAAAQSKVEESRAVAEQIISEYSSTQPDADLTGARQLVGVDEVRTQLALLTDRVHTEVLTFAPGSPPTEENMRASRPLNARLLGRGVRMRTVYLDSIKNSNAALDNARWLVERGAEVRTLPALPARMIILDRATALVSADELDSSLGATMLTGSGVLSALCALFDNLWRTAGHLGDPPPREDAGLTPPEAAALNMLAAGMTDDAVAKRLGVSTRTARRIASTLMENLGARSRFQAGALAERLGMLDDIEQWSGTHPAQ
ncbi:LuxR family transcriptional regulator [Winogradskya humida]|uniref:LuxR family transcriptional regulator n=1 Tax=Winogradskya humida TaxID=113566 RepID=A0ABQ4A477_9ACTN|nr:LuxR family transcriptional regulator [Actinoplanes humidus]